MLLLWVILEISIVVLGCWEHIKVAWSLLGTWDIYRLLGYVGYMYGFISYNWFWVVFLMNSWVPAPLEVWHGGMDGRYIVLVLAWLLLELVCI